MKIEPSDRRLSYYRGVALVLEKKDPAIAEKIFAPISHCARQFRTSFAFLRHSSGSANFMKTKTKPDLAADAVSTCSDPRPTEQGPAGSVKQAEEEIAIILQRRAGIGWA